MMTVRAQGVASIMTLYELLERQQVVTDFPSHRLPCACVVLLKAEGFFFFNHRCHWCLYRCGTPRDWKFLLSMQWRNVDCHPFYDETGAEMSVSYVKTHLLFQGATQLVKQCLERCADHGDPLSLTWCGACFADLYMDMSGHSGH